jgi:chromate transporter
MLPGAQGQLGAMALAALFGQLLPVRAQPEHINALPVVLPMWVALPALGLFLFGLFGLPLLAELQGGQTLGLFDRFFRAGSLVFGGGHVVLPLLRDALVAPGWIADDKFLSGYALAQTVPGPLFTFAAYVGGVVTGGWTGAALCTIGIFLPSFLMLFGVLPFWHRLGRFPPVRRALAGVNAAVVGLLLAALYDPVFTSSVHAAPDFIVAVTLFLLLRTGKVPVPLLVVVSALAGFVI